MNLQFLQPDQLVPADRRDAVGQIDFRGSRFERPPIVLTGVTTDTAIDTNGNGLFDELQVALQVDLELPEEVYRFTARLSDGQNAVLAFAVGAARLNAGRQDIVLRFDGRKIRRSGVPGPYTVDNLMIFTLAGVSLGAVNAVARTRPYAATQFEP